MSLKDVDGMANSVDPDRSSLIWDCTVCSGLSVRKFKIITVLLSKISQGMVQPRARPLFETCCYHTQNSYLLTFCLNLVFIRKTKITNLCLFQCAGILHVLRIMCERNNIQYSSREASRVRAFCENN